MKEKYAAVILAAGKGTRMNEGSSAPIPKVMFKLGEKTIIDHSIGLVRQAGVNDVVLVVGYMREMIEEYLGDSVSYAVQDEQLGTGHATMMARDLLVGKTDSVIVFYGDSPLYRPETVKALIDLYEREKPAIGMLTATSADPTGYGRVICDDRGDVLKIVEHKDCSQEELLCKVWNPGFYIFNADWLWENITNLSSNNAQHEYYLTDLIAMAKDQDKRVVAMPVSEEDEALGINDLDQLKYAEGVLFKRR